MKRYYIVICYTLLTAGFVQQAYRSSAQDRDAAKGEIERVQSEIRLISTALYRGDLDTLIKFTHPKVIELLGGNAKAREALEVALKTLTASKVAIEELNFPAPPTFLNGKAHEFVIVPTKSIYSVNGKRAESLNYQFGARAIGAADWKYLEGSRVKKENVHAFFPDFPKDYAFPEISRKLIDKLVR